MTENQEKIQIIERLVKEGHLNLKEAVILLEEKIIKEYILQPYYYPPTIIYRDNYFPYYQPFCSGGSISTTTDNGISNVKFTNN